MDRQRRYTIRQIAEIGLDKYKIRPYKETRDATIDNIRKQIEKIIKQEEIEPIGMEKSTPSAKRPARAYSNETKDQLLNDYLFDYLVDLSQDEAVKKYTSPTVYAKKADELNGKYEDETLAFLNFNQEEQDALQEKQNNSVPIDKYHSLIREKKKEIMLEAIFSKYYSLNVDELIEDAKRVEFANNYKQGEFDKDDMRAFARFDNWENYVKEK